ncbi:MAG TPA: sugar phosphate isomerase/epimerase [Burkholderiaceae bacterium]
MRKASLLLLLCLLPFAARAEAPPPRIGVQLWSVKDDVKRDFAGTLEKLAKMGFEGVEFAGEFGPYGNDAGGLRALLDKLKLQCAGAHVDFAALAPGRFAAATAYYRRAGCSKLIIAMDRRAFMPDGAALVAGELSALSKQLAPLGMQIGYHNHDAEMAGPVGATPWDVIARGTPGPLQLDIGWAVYAGKDPVALIGRYPGRTRTAHFKAKLAKNTAGTPVIGRDTTDWRAVYRAARDVGGAEWIVLEQEDYPDGLTPLAAVAASLQGLRRAMSD